MSGDFIKDTAEALYLARAQGRRIPPLDPQTVGSLDAAYDIRDACDARASVSIVGWKVGGTAPAAWEAIGASEPFYARLLAPFCVKDGADVPVPERILGLECEYAFTLARDLPVRAEPYTRADVEAAIRNVFPALEIVGLRQDIPKPQQVFQMIADFGTNVGFVAGTPVEDWRSVDYTGQEIAAIVNGETKTTGTGKNVFGHPLDALTWAANKASSRGHGLHAGQFVTTGSTVGIVPASKGETVAGDFGPLGRIEARLV